MNAFAKSAAALATVSLFALAVPAQAGMGPCMPMMMAGSVAPACNGQPAVSDTPRACPVREEGKEHQAGGCGTDGPMAGMMGDMAAGGMNIAMAVMGAIFGPPRP